MGVQPSWLTTEGRATIGHSRKTFIDRDGKQSRKAVARRLGSASMPKKVAPEPLRKLIVEEIGITERDSTTFEDFIKSRWIPTRKGDWRLSSRGTIVQKPGTFYDHFNKCCAESREIESVELQSLSNQLAEKSSGSTVRISHAYLKSIFEEAVEQDYIRKTYRDC